MRTAFLGITTALLVLSAPLIPLAAHAHMGLGLSGAAALELNGIAADSVLDAAAEVDANVATNPVIVTRASLATSVTTESTASSTLETRANAIAEGDENVSAVVLSKEEVALSYRTPAKLLGIVTVDIPVTVSVDAAGAVEVSYPWYSFLFSTNRAALAIRAQAALENTFAARVESTSTLSAQEQLRLIDSLHTALKSQSDISTTVSLENR